ncbi:hypothetical protein AADZ91_08210 [Colwelliaceae bacterium 6441]
MDSLTPFYKQLNARLLLIFTFVLFLLILALFLLQYRDSQVLTLIEKHLPSWENSYQQQAKYIEVDQLLAKIIHSENSQGLVAEHQLMIATLTDLKSLSTQNKRLVEQLIYVEKNRQEHIKRLSNNYSRNQLLKQNSLIQLQLVLDELQTELADKEAKQTELFQQITQDKATASRAKAHVNITQSVDRLRETYQAVKNVDVLFRRLNLQYSLEEFNYLTDEISLSLALWQANFDLIESANTSEQPLLKVLYELRQLFFIEQNTIAKWRGHIRIAQEYFQALAEHKEKLNSQLHQLTPPLMTVTVLPPVVEKIINQIPLKNAQLMQVIVAVFYFIGALILWGLLRQVSKRVQRQSQVSLALAKNVIDGEKAQYSTREDKQLNDLLLTIVHPAHNENEYQALEQRMQTIQKNLCEYGNIAYFSFAKEDNTLENQLALELVFSGDRSTSGDRPTVAEKSWLAAFSFQALRTIMKNAKLAKKQNEVQQFDVINRFVQLITITVYYHNNSWQGTLKVQEQKSLLLEQINQLEEQVYQQKDEHYQSLVNKADKLSKMLIRTMLQSQSVSIGSGVTSLQVYRQLTRLLDWCRQLQISNELQNTQKISMLNDVVIRNELVALTQNIMVEANQQRNTLLLRLDRKLLTRAKVNIRLFHRTLLGVARLCLLEQFKSTMCFSAEIVDKNSGQQIIRFSFDVQAKQPKGVLPEIIQALIDHNIQDSQIIQYLHTLLSATHCSNITANVTETGFKVTIDMPLAFAENDAKNTDTEKAINFKKAQVILLSEKHQFIDEIAQSIATHHGKVEVFEKVSPLVKQLTVKHLNVQPVKAIVVSAKLYSNEQNVITEHIASLPKPLQPKLVILQSHFSPSLHREGFFEYSESPCESMAFVQYLCQFTQGDKANNLLIAPEKFSGYHFSPTQVEVLLAVEQPERYQTLARLLHWLGLQVHIVCQAKTMLKHWQTGRYLVLFTEFQDSAFVEMQVGKNVNRGVFSLTNKTLESANKKQSKNIKHWQQGSVLDCLDIEQLITLLSPWLKEKQQLIAVKKQETKDRAATIANEQKALVKTSTKTNQLSTIDLTPSSPVIEQTQTFDLHRYAKNQGSPELAVFMLEDYLAELNDAIKDTSALVDTKNFTQAIEKNMEIQQVSKILAANDLYNASKEVEEALNKKAIVEVNAKIKQLLQQYHILIEFSQAI